jgi:hypothetical protein
VPAGVTATAAGLSITLGWSASTDNVGVAGYRVERCQGAGCILFAQTATPATPGFIDAGLAASTSYNYRVVAVDGAGNVSGYSTVVSATTGAAPVLPAGLIAGYSFDAGSGTTVADVSGHGNNGGVSGGTTWTTGKYGGGMAFDGVNGLVTVSPSTSLNVGAGFTLAAWIQPTASQSGWRTIIQRQTDNYFLNASNGNAAMVPSGGATVGSGTPVIYGTTACPLNAWTHVAMTFDGATMRLYVNGVQVATKAANGSVVTSTAAMYLGGNVPYGEYFRGIIDEAQVYNRPLTPSEVQTVMTTPLS